MPHSVRCFGVAAVALMLIASPATGADRPARTFRLDISGGVVPKAQRALRVVKGDRVRLIVASDAAGELHVHGYRIAMTIASGGERETAFDAHATGRYPLEWHASATSQGNRGHHAPPLAVLEVHPQ